MSSPTMDEIRHGERSLRSDDPLGAHPVATELREYFLSRAPRERPIDLLPLINRMRVKSLTSIGMFKVTVDRTMDLHVWDDEQGWAIHLPHSHVYGFESLVLRGQITTERFEVMPTTREGTHERLTLNATTLQHLGIDPVVLRSRALETTREGESYRLEATEVHHAMPAPGTITLVCDEVGRNRPVVVMQKYDHAEVLRFCGWRAPTDDDMARLREIVGR